MAQFTVLGISSVEKKKVFVHYRAFIILQVHFINYVIVTHRNIIMCILQIYACFAHEQSQDCPDLCFAHKQSQDCAASPWFIPQTMDPRVAQIHALRVT